SPCAADRAAMARQTPANVAVLLPAQEYGSSDLPKQAVVCGNSLALIRSAPFSPSVPFCYKDESNGKMFHKNSFNSLMFSTAKRCLFRLQIRSENSLIWPAFSFRKTPAMQS